MVLVDETLKGRRPDITALGLACSHRNEDGSSAWDREVSVGRMGFYEHWVCLRCGRGERPSESLREAVRECVEDR